MAVTYVELGLLCRGTIGFLKAILYNPRKSIYDLPYLFRCLEHNKTLLNKQALFDILTCAKTYLDQVTPCLQLVYLFYEAIINNECSYITSVLLPKFLLFFKMKSDVMLFISVLFLDHLSQVCMHCNKQKTILCTVQKVMNT